MQNLPANWLRAKLPEICEIIRGVSYKKAISRSENMRGYLPILRATNITERGLILEKELVYIPSEIISDHQKLKIGDIVVATSSGSKHLVGKAAQLKKTYDGSFGAFCAVIRPSNELDYRYLGYYFNSPEYKDFISSRAIGVNINNFRKSDFKDIYVPIAPKNEQKRIVTEIEKQFSRLDEVVDNLKRVKVNLKRYKASVLKAAVEGKLTEEWRAEHPDVEPAEKLLERILTERRKKWEEAELIKMKSKGKEPKDDKWKKKYNSPKLPNRSELPIIPVGWDWATPELLANDEDNAICAGPFGTIFKAKDFRPKGIPIIFLRHVSPGKYLTHKPGFMDSAKWDKLFRSYSVYGGELLITKLGDPPGVCAKYPSNIGPAMVTPDVIKMNVNKNCADSSYLMNYFNSQMSRSLAADLAFGTTRLRLTLPIFRNLPIPLPPLNEQSKIVGEIESRVSQAEELEKSTEANLLRANSLRQSILKLAFSGKLVVQDLQDEPVEKLLERIKSEIRENNVELLKKRKKSMSSKVKSREKQDILVILGKSEGSMRPEELFREAGYNPEEVEEFYAELKAADQKGSILQEKLKTGETYLRIKR